MHPKLLFSLKEVTVRNRHETVLENVSFEMFEGQHMALFGSSDNEKKALLELIAGKLPISAGSFITATNEPSTTKQRTTAFVPARNTFVNFYNNGNAYYQQRYEITNSEKTATVHQYLLAIEHKANKPYWDYDKVVDRLALSPVSGKEIIQLSTGETKRVFIAAALLSNPDILLLENPFNGLDQSSRSNFNLLVSEIAASGIHLVISIQDAGIPPAITHIAVVENKRIRSIVPKSSFEIAAATMLPAGKLDTAELSDLLSIHKKADFKIIVGMEQVTVRYADKVILDRISWTIRQGEKWALTGPNGAGKSTLLSLINAENPQAYSNNIVLFDRKRGSGESVLDIKKKIGYVSPELFQYIPRGNTCSEVVESGLNDTLGLAKTSNISKAALCLRWLKVFGIEELADLKFNEVPAGKQRLCLLARALVKNPPLLILDEPCQDLNSSQKANFKNILEHICEHSDITLIYVSHYPEEMPRNIMDTLELNLGKIVR